MALAGSLFIEMSSNVARITADMNATKGIVGGAMSSVEKSVASAKSMLASLGIGLGVGYFVSLIKGSIDAMDRLHDLSLTIKGVTVETLAGLGVAAKQSGSDLDGTAKSINFLSKNMGANAAEFKKLGITAKDPLEAFKQLSDIFVAIQDPQQRAAVAAKALGKAWESAAPLLAEGGKKIGEMVEAGTKASGVTKEMTDQADALKDKLVLLIGTGGLLTRMVGPMLPLLNTMADEMLKVSDSAGKIDGSFKPMLETLRALVIMGGEFAFVWQQIGISFAGVGAQFSAFKSGGMKALLDTRAMISDILNEERKLHDAWVARMMAAGTPGSPTPGGPKPATVSTAGVAGFIDNGKAANDALKEAERYRKMDADGWVKYIDAVNGEYEDGLREQAKLNEDYWKKKDELRVADQAAMFAMFDAEQDAAIATGEIMSQEITEDSKRWTEAADEVSEAWRTAAKDMQRSMSGFFFDVMEGNLTDLGGSFLKMVRKMLADALAAKATLALVGNDFTSGGNIGGLIGSLISGFSSSSSGSGSFTGANNFDLAMAGGGSFGAGDRVMVGERGPEVVQFNRGGNVIPNNAIGGSNVQINVINKADPVDVQQSAPRIDSGQMIIDVVLTKLHSDANVRNSFRGAIGAPA